MRFFFIIAVATAATFLASCGNAKEGVYVPGQEEVLLVEGNSLFGDFYVAEVEETIATYGRVYGGIRFLQVAGRRPTGEVLLLSVWQEGGEVTSSLSFYTPSEWEESWAYQEMADAGGLRQKG